MIKEIIEENRRIRYLRILVDLVINLIYEGDILYEDAINLIESVKSVAIKLFPDKEATFELIYRPRFKRVLRERYNIC
jgi:hypothetical protein